jgi:hypothetical protein
MLSEIDYKQFEFTPRQREMMLELAYSAREALQEQRLRAVDEERDFRPPLEPIDQLLQEIAKFIYHVPDAQYRKISLSKPLLILLLFEIMQRLSPNIEDPAPTPSPVTDERLHLYYFLSFGLTYHFTMREYHGYFDQFRSAAELARNERQAHRFVNTAGMDEVAVFTALYNAAKPQGMGFLHDDPQDITLEEGAKLYYEQLTEAEKNLLDDEDREKEIYPKRFDYVNGRRMKISRRDIERGYIDVTNYEVGNGAGSALRAVENLPRI